MKESSWEECIESNSSVKITPDTGKAKSLIETAKGRIAFLEQNTLTADNVSYVFEGYYSSVLELFHALVIQKGYKVHNHICLGYFFRDVLKREDLFRLFDDSRFKRNRLVYYGKRLDFETAKDSIRKCKELKKAISDLIGTL